MKRRLRFASSPEPERENMDRHKMKKRASCLFAIAAAPILVVVACGGDDKKPPTTAATTPSASASSDTPPSASASGSGSPSGSSGPAASSAPDPSAPAADAGGGAPKPVVVENKDECTPVGVDFEKRARPKLKECYATGKKATKNPNLEGTVKIKITVDVKGKIKSTKVIEKTLPDSVADCMLNAVKSTPFPEVEKCWDSTLTIPVTFPTPK